MKVLSTDGLTKLIQLIKSTFIKNTDTVAVTTVQLSTVATSGSYNDLSNKPTIPSALDDLSNVTISSPTQGQNLTYDATNQVWKNTSTTATIAWGGITGTLSDQTDLQNALDSKLTSADLTNYVTTNTEQTITSKKTFNTRVNFLGSGDANAIYLSTDTRIDVHGTTNTVLGFASGTFLINNAAYNLKLRGKQTRPVYNSDSNPIALLSDVPTDTGDLTNNAGYIKGITSSDVTTALGYNPVNPSSLATVATSGDYDDLINKPTIPSEVTESTVSGWGFTKNTGTVTSVNNVSPVNGNVTLSIPSTDNLANKDLSNLTTTGNNKFQVPLVSGTNIKTINSTSLLGNGNINVADTNLSNLSATGQSVIDGQWTVSQLTITSNVTAPTTDTAYSLATYLPNDGQIYEVMFSNRVTTNATSGSAVLMQLQSDIGLSCYGAGAGTRANATIASCASIVLPIGAARKITVLGSNDYAGKFALYANGYRRIGTNA